MPPEPIRIPVAPRRTRSGTRVAVFATGLAASLVIAMIVLPKHSQEIVVAPRPQTAVPQTVTPPPATVRPAIIRRETPRAVPPKPKPKIQYYVALDDEPIETGLVVRVGLSGGQIPADVIIGPDGRARAIRLVSDVSGEPK